MILDSLYTNEIGEFGRYQKLTTFLISLYGIAAAFNTFETIFTAATPSFHCYQTGDFSNSTSSLVPSNDGCYLENITSTSEGHPGDKLSCSSWEYDLSEFGSTIVTKFDLVCSRSWLPALSRSVFMFGMLIGNLMTGAVSDGYGRRLTFVMSILTLICAQLMSALAKDFYVYLAARFFIAAADTSAYMSALVLGVELVGASKSSLVNLCMTSGWVLGYCLIVGISYICKDSRNTQLVITATYVLFLPYYWLLPRSPRWLYSKKKFKEAENVFISIAKKNGTTIDIQSLSAFTQEIKSKDESEDERPGNNLLSIWKSRIMLPRVLIMILTWMSISFVYYGLTFGIDAISGNIYINTVLHGILELPAYVLGMLLLQKTKLGRVKSLMASLFMSSLCVLGMAVAPSGIAEFILSMMGKFCITLAFYVVYVCTAEIFPTTMRNSCLGLGSAGCRAGSMMSPFVAKIARSHPVIQPIILGVPAFIAISFLPLLPETGGKNLPETLEEAERMTSVYSCCRRRDPIHESNEMNKC